MLYIALLKVSSFSRISRIKIEQKHSILNTWCYIKCTQKVAEGNPSKMHSISKKPLSAQMKRKIINLNEKMKLIVFAKKNPTFGSRKLGEIHGIGKHQLQAY